MSEQVERPHRAVGLVEIGERLPLSLVKLARRLNRMQPEFRFQVVGTITLEALGEPEVKDHSYDAQALHQRLLASGFAPKFDFLVGVTNERVAVKPLGSKRFEIDYFSLGNFSQVAVISTHRSVAYCRGPTVTMDQYVAHLLMGELLMLIAKAVSVRRV